MSRAKKNVPLTRIVYRNEPAPCGYHLSIPEYNRLVAEGFDPETVDDSVLQQRAEAMDIYDDQGRVDSRTSLVDTIVTTCTYSAWPQFSDSPLQGEKTDV